MLLNEIAVESNIETDFINLDNPVALKSALKENTKASKACTYGLSSMLNS